MITFPRSGGFGSKKYFDPGLIMFSSLFGVLSLMSVLKYVALNSTFQDLGIFLNHFYNISHGEWWRPMIVHFQPFMWVFGGMYKVLPGFIGPILILLLQACFLSLPIIGLYRLYGYLPTLAFALYFPLWFNALFDFHMDHLAVPLLFGFFFSIREGKFNSAILFATLLALVKEIYALQTLFCGLYLILFYRRVPHGAVLVLIGFLVFFLTQNYFVPYFSIWVQEGHHFKPAYSWMGDSPGAILGFIFSHPLTVLSEIFSNREKTNYLMWIFGALLFIPILKPKVLFIALPILGINLLSHTRNFYGLEFHYTAGLIAPLVTGFAEGQPVAERIRRLIGLSRTWFGPLLIVGLLFAHVWKSASPVSRHFWEPYWPYNAVSYLPSDRDQMIKKALHENIAPDFTATVSIQNSVNWHYLVNRKYLLAFPNGIHRPSEYPLGRDRSVSGLLKFIWTGEQTPPKVDKKSADYVVLDLKRPWFLIDRGCAWQNGKCRDDDEFASRFLSTVQQTKERFDTVFQKDGFYILKRKHLPAALR